MHLLLAIAVICKELTIKTNTNKDSEQSKTLSMKYKNLKTYYIEW